MRYIGLDLGERTLGISISNGIIANVYKTIRHNEEYSRLIDEVSLIIEEEKIDKVVLGFPKNMNNTIGKRAKITLDFKKQLEDKIEETLEELLKDFNLNTK